MAFELVDFVPKQRGGGNAAHEALNMELMGMLAKVQIGKSLRQAFQDLKEAQSYRSTLNGFLKRQDLHKTYFTGLRRTAEKDGKFYVYVGRRKE